MREYIVKVTEEEIIKYKSLQDYLNIVLLQNCIPYYNGFIERGTLIIEKNPQDGSITYTWRP